MQNKEKTRVFIQIFKNFSHLIYRKIYLKKRKREMTNNYCVMTIRKIKSMRSLQMSHEHNLREISLSNVDVSLSDRNEELINDTGYGYRDLWYQRMKDIELKTGEPVTKRKNAVLAYEIVTTFSKGADVNMEAWKEANIKWMKDTFGEENVLSMQLHEDEITPHIHTIVIPIDERNKLCARSFTGGIKKNDRFTKLLRKSNGTFRT